MSRVIDELRWLQQIRGRREADTSIGKLFAETAERATRTQQRLGALIELWQELVGQDLSVHTKVAALRGGVAHVVADSSATAYELDRMLRSGLQQELRRRYPATLSRIKVTVGRV